MFSGASAFNRPLDSWDVSSVTDMQYMFYGASAFNQPLASWDVSSVTDMRYIFRDAAAFNHSLGSWRCYSPWPLSFYFYGSNCSGCWTCPDLAECACTCPDSAWSCPPTASPTAS